MWDALRPLRRSQSIHGRSLNPCGRLVSQCRSCANLLLAARLYPRPGHSIVTNKAFEVFNCHDFGAEDGTWLVADVLVECGSPEHARIVAWAWIGIGLYPIGWTALTALLLFLARKAVTGGAKETGLSKALLFIVAEYETPFFWCAAR